MSYFTHVDFQFSDELPAVAEILVTARAYLDSQGCYSVEHVLEALTHGVEAGNYNFKGFMCDDFEGLMTSISEAFPAITFHVRGMGEEYGDVWLRRFEDGKIISRIGPFEDG